MRNIDRFFFFFFKKLIYDAYQVKEGYPGRSETTPSNVMYWKRRLAGPLAPQLLGSTQQHKRHL